MRNEIWKEIPRCNGLYQASNLGNIRKIIPSGFKNVNKTLSADGYFRVYLTHRGISTHVHQLIAETFLDHKPNGHTLVVNHKNFIRNDNRVENLEIITARENCNKKHIQSLSKYTGVSLHKKSDTYRCRIFIDNNEVSLGYFHKEFYAHLVYEHALSNIHLYDGNKIKFSKLIRESVRLYDEPVYQQSTETKIMDYLAEKGIEIDEEEANKIINIVNEN